MRVQFVHGLESSPQGKKARLFAQHFEARTPGMDTTDFEGCVQLQARVLEEFEPDLLIGSSFGGAVVVALLQRGLWRGNTLLLAQASRMFLAQPRLPPNFRVTLLHGTDDEVVDIADSRVLAATGTPGYVELIEVDDDHQLSRSVESGALIELVRRIAAQ
jgi:alpha/beta superfamily hydrolase